MTRTSDEEWATKHKAEVRDFFREQCLAAIAVHLPCAGDSGHLTQADMALELASLAVYLGGGNAEIDADEGMHWPRDFTGKQERYKP